MGISSWRWTSCEGPEEEVEDSVGNAEPLSQLARRLRLCGHQPEEVERVEVDEVGCEERDERRVHPPVQPPHPLRP